MSGAFLIAWAVVVYSFGLIGLFTVVDWLVSKRKPKG
jgi:hypothetical protein